MRLFTCQLFIFGVIFSFLSCQKDDDNFEVFNIIDNRLDLNDSCGIDGNDCGQPITEQSYLFMSSNSNEQITWSIVDGDITLISGQGTSVATFKLGSDFSQGIIQVESNICLLKKTISLCN